VDGLDQDLHPHPEAEMSGPIATASDTVLMSPGVGWPLLPLPDADGALAWPDPALSVRQMLEVILRTAPGEQLMRPLFGAGLETLINTPNTLTTRAQAQEAVTNAVRAYEPRIILDRVDVDVGADPREMVVTLSYRLTLTGDSGQITATVPVGAG
jgi:phage baseplate assembly protein W